MHARLGTEHAERVLALDGKGGAVDADDLGRGAVVDRDLPAAARAVLHVHLEEHEGPVLRLETALPRLDGDDAVAVVELAGKPARELKLIDTALKLGGGAGRLGHELAGLGVLPHLVRKLERGAGVGEMGAGVLDSRDIGLGGGDLGHHGASGIGIVPKTGLGALGLERSHARGFLVKVQIPLDLVQARGQSVERGGVHLFGFGHPLMPCRGSS